MTIRSPVPPVGANHTEWHAARDAEVRADECWQVLNAVENLSDEQAHAEDGCGHQVIYMEKLYEIVAELRGPVPVPPIDPRAARALSRLVDSKRGEP